jgi:serine/threonine protein phosphatase PrpC
LQRVEGSVALQGGAQAWRVHWIGAADVPGWRPQLERRLALALACLAPGQLRASPSGLWLFIEASGRAWAPWAAASGDPLERVAELLAPAGRLASALAELHQNGLLCLTFDPSALEEVAPEAPPRFTNLDVDLFRAGILPERVSAHHNFIPPAVSAFRAAEMGPRTDVYHLALFAYYWLAGLLPEGFPGTGLEAFEYALPFLRIYAPGLPEGICAVVMRGLAPEPAQRYATPADLVAALAEAVARARARRSFQGSLRWEIGAHTRTGRAKTALHGDNEDQTLVKHFAEGALIAVADGVSTCHVGSGGLASLLTVVVVEAAFAFGTSHEAFAEQAVHACRRGAQSIVDWALEKGYRSQLHRGADLMGTTLTLGWLQGRRLSLANLGDSRAYLITPAGGAEQLTVDGDLASALLARRLPPEDVRGLGFAGRSLRECVGGCLITNEGEVKPLPESGRPALTSWPLLPGDVLVLCSDGLVEEGIFLSAEALAEFVLSHGALSARELALRLADEADALQQLPSALDPNGMGDNIACVVVKIEAAETPARSGD